MKLFLSALFFAIILVAVLLWSYSDIDRCLDSADDGMTCGKFAMANAIKWTPF
jgi:hypothetical protein